MVRLGRWYRLSLGYFVALLLFTAVFSWAIQRQWIDANGAAQLGTLVLIGFLLVGWVLCMALARYAQQSQPVWVYALLYAVFAALAGLGAWILLGYLTYLAHKKINLGNSHGL